jgi:hypothetical protein
MKMEVDDSITVPALPAKRPRGPIVKRKLGMVPGRRPVRIWQDATTGEVCFRPHRKRRVERRSLAELWDLVSGQTVML